MILMPKVHHVVILSRLNLSDDFRKQQASTYYVETRKGEAEVWQLKGGNIWTVEAGKEKERETWKDGWVGPQKMD